LKAFITLVESFGQIGFYEDAISYGNTAIDMMSNSDSFNTEDKSRLYSSLARVLWVSKENNDLSLQYTRQALAIDRMNEDARSLLRQIANKISPHSKYFRLTVGGKHDSQTDLITYYDVIADNSEEAIELAKDFEPNDFSETFQIENSLELRVTPHELKGVYVITGMIFLPI
jgi:hypothetical protein